MTLKFIRIYLLSIGLFFAISPTSEAADVHSTKLWTITFSTAIQPSSIQSEHIYIQAPSGTVHPTTLTQISETAVQIQPTMPYTESGTYTIVVERVEDRSHTLVTPFTTTFTYEAVPKATWIWNAYALSEEDAQFLIAQHVTKVYVQVEHTLRYEAYIPFFETLRAHNIDIYALEGFAGLQFQDAQKTARFIDWVTSFQQQYGYFTGIHLDIEPYTAPSWQWNEDVLLEQYFTYVQQMQQFADTLALQFEIDMPFWFDEVSYTNSFGTGIAAEWLIDHSDEVTIMAYRNSASAVIPLVAHEFMYAQAQHKQITIALETAESFEGDFLSFYNMSPIILYNAMDTLYETYNTTIALHYLPTWQAILQP